MAWDDLAAWNIGDIFKAGDSKTTVVDPLATQKTSAADYLSSLLNTQYPRQQIAGMTDLEKYGQDYLSKYVSGGMPAGFGAASDYFNSVLGQPTDITQLPEYKAIINSVNSQTNDAVNQRLRQMQLSGMGNSSPQGRAVGREIAAGGQNMLASLAPLAEGERNRQGSAAGSLASLAQLQESINQGRIGAISQYGGLPRQLDQASLNALFQQMMAPYTTGTNIAGTLGGMGVDYTATQDPSIMEQISPMIGPLMMMMMMSDERTKENIEDVDDAIRKIKKLRAKSYNYKTADPADRRVGIMAQDIEKVMPEAVRKVNGVRFVDYTAVASLAAEAVSELIREVEELKRRKRSA